MTNHEAAMILFNIASILELARGNPYRIRAYRNTARNLLRLREPARDILARGEQLPLPGLGKRLRKKLDILFKEGGLPFYDELVGTLPVGAQGLMAVEFVGPKTACRLDAELQIHTAEELLAAAQAGKIRKLRGFGERSEARLARGAAALLAPKPTPIAA